MSASFFDTILAADVRTSPDGRGVEWARHGEGIPHLMDVGWANKTRETFVGVHPNAEQVLKIAADTIETTVMEGLSGDFPEHRAQLGKIIRAVANATRELALDADCDGALRPGDWESALNKIVEESKALTKKELNREVKG